MRRMLIGATGLVLAVLLSGSAAAVAAPSHARPVPPAPATAARPPAMKAPGALPRAASSGRAAAAASAAPVFNNYLTCFNGYIYTDFTDPDGDDTLLNVQVWALQRSTGTWAATWMMNTGPSVHGVFFWLYAPDVNFNTSDVSYYYFRAMDQTGVFSGWTVATGNTDGSCQLT